MNRHSSQVVRSDRLGAVLSIVLGVLALRAAWREARDKEGRPAETTISVRLADVVAALPPDRRIAFVDLGGDFDAHRRARVDLRLALAPRVLFDENPAAPAFVTWTYDSPTLDSRSTARGYGIDRALSDGYVLLRRTAR